MVVGAGMSGIAAARTLTAAGVDTVVLDRGHRVGGRMASRRIDDRVADIGASYFTVSDARFEAIVEDWQSRRLAGPWTDTFLASGGPTMVAKTGPMRWAAPAGLRGLVEDLAVGLDVRRQSASGIDRDRRVDGIPTAAVVLAMPDPQALRLLAPEHTDERAALTDPYEPALALTARWTARSWSADLDGVFVSDDPVLAWVADDGRRRGDDAPVLVAHSTPGLAAHHLTDPDAAGPTMVHALRELLQLAEEPVSVQVHRWTFAKPAGTRTLTHLLSDRLVGLCGDSWSDRPRVESAYLSGVALATALIDRLA